MPSRPPAPLAPRGPLPAGTYWRRRLFVGLLALSIVFVVGRWLTAGGDGSSGEQPVAEQAGAQVEATTTVTAGSEEALGREPTTPAVSGKASPAATPTLAQPDGPCAASDVAATPRAAAGQAAGQDVTLQVALQTVTSEACTWTVSASSLVVRVSQGRAQRWSTQQCTAAVATRSIVVRRSVATVVEVVWNARESDQRCSTRTNWVLPGDFTVSAAAIGGDPASAEFTLVAPGEAVASEEPVEQRWESGL